MEQKSTLRKRIVYKRSQEASVHEPDISEYLFKSIQQLVINTNENEKKLDDISLKQATIPNLLFTAAFLSPKFLRLLTISPLFKYTYIGVMCSFFITLFATILATTIEKRKAKSKLRKSQSLYTKIMDRTIILPNKEELVNEQIRTNNQTDDKFLLIII